MGFIENIRVGEERAQAGFGAEQDRPSAMFSAGKIVRIGVAEDASTQGDELTRTGDRPGNISHQFIFEIAVAPLSASGLQRQRLFYFRNEHFERAEVQILRVEVNARADSAGK